MSLTLRKLILTVMLVTGAALSAASTPALACGRYDCDRHYGYRYSHSHRHYSGCSHRHSSYDDYGHGHGWHHDSCRTYVSWVPFWPFGHGHHHRSHYRSCRY